MEWYCCNWFAITSIWKAWSWCCVCHCEIYSRMHFIQLFKKHMEAVNSSKVNQEYIIKKYFPKLDLYFIIIQVFVCNLLKKGGLFFFLLKLLKCAVWTPHPKTPTSGCRGDLGLKNVFLILACNDTIFPKKGGLFFPRLLKRVVLVPPTKKIVPPHLIFFGVPN